MTINLLTILYAEQSLTIPAGEDNNPSLNSEQIVQLCGWQLKDVGLCKGDQCIPLGRYRCDNTQSLLLTVTALVELLRLPVAADSGHSVKLMKL